MKDNFFMFDVKRGILILRHFKNPFEFLKDKKNNFYYYLTNNGGETWKKKSYKLKTKGLQYQNNEQFLMCEYSDSGEAIITILKPSWNSLPNKRELKDRKLLELRSTDFGKHFTEKDLR